jgi:hypothetical protein
MRLRLLFVLSVLALGGIAPTASAEPGRVQYRLDAKSYADSIPLEWFSHVQRIMAYPPFGDRYTSLVPTLAYHDAYTTWGTNGLNPTRRAEYVKWVERDKAAGYAGQFMDDINYAGGNRNTGPELTALVEAVRGALGPTGILEINAQMWDLLSVGLNDPNVARALAVTNMVDKEFGVGPISGINSPSKYAQFLAYVDALHQRGAHIDLVSSAPGDLYSLASYLLLSDGGDFIGAHAEPPGWWAGFDTNLGNTVSPTRTHRWEKHPGVYARQFERGAVFVVAPGAGTWQIVLPANVMYDVNGAAVEETITLSGGQGAVLHY